MLTVMEHSPRTLNPDGIPVMKYPDLMVHARSQEMAQIGEMLGRMQRDGTNSSVPVDYRHASHLRSAAFRSQAVPSWPFEQESPSSMLTDGMQFSKAQRIGRETGSSVRLCFKRRMNSRAESRRHVKRQTSPIHLEANADRCLAIL